MPAFRKKTYGKKRFPNKSYKKRGYAGGYRKKSYSYKRTFHKKGLPYKGRMPRGTGCRGETKAVDLSGQNLSFTSTVGTSGTGLNFIQTGSSFNNRVGRKVAMKSLHIEGSIVPAAIAAYTQEYARIIIVYDAQTNGVAPLWSDVIQAYTQNNVPSNTSADGLNLNNRDRFKLLLDKRYVFPQTSAAGIPLNPVPEMREMQLKEFIKLGNLETQYKADTSPAVIGDIATGGLFLLVQSSTGAQWNLSYTTRLRYTDN